MESAVPKDAALGPTARRRLHSEFEPARLKFGPTASKIVRLEPNRAIAFRTLTNNSTWAFEITPTPTGSKLTERRLVPQKGTAWLSKTVVEHILGGEDSFDDEMVDGMNTTLTKMKVAVEHAW